MSSQIDTAFVKQYHDNIERLLQQKGSKLRNYVRVESQEGEEQFWDQIGSVEASEVNTRFADSPQVDTPHSRRRCTLRQFDIGDAIDKFDKVKLLIDPSSTYVQNFVDALSRAIDVVVIGRDTIGDASTINGGFFGTAFTGKAGATSTAFTSGNAIAVDFSSTGTNSNLTINKVIEAGRLLRSLFNDPEVEPWYMGVSSSQIASMLKTTQVTSSDYNTMKALVRGDVDSFAGFKFVPSEYYLTDASSYRLLPVWAKSGMLLSIGKDIVTRVGERPDKKFVWYAYAMLSVGSTRMQENKVLKILCDETK